MTKNEAEPNKMLTNKRVSRLTLRRRDDPIEKHLEWKKSLSKVGLFFWQAAAASRLLPPQLSSRLDKSNDPYLVWNNTCMKQYLYETLLVWNKTCMKQYLYETILAWNDTGMKQYLYETILAWNNTCMKQYLYETILVWNKELFQPQPCKCISCAARHQF